MQDTFLCSESESRLGDVSSYGGDVTLPEVSDGTHDRVGKPMVTSEGEHLPEDSNNLNGSGNIDKEEDEVSVVK